MASIPTCFRKEVRNFVVYFQGQYTLAFAQEDLAKATLLRSLLDNLYTNLQPVIQDLKSPNTSKAYETFFKDPANKNFITTLFENIAAGAPVYPPTNPPQPWQKLSPKGSPLIMVLSQLGQLIYTDDDGKPKDGFTRCQENAEVTAFVSYNEDKIPFIFLCPFFFDAKPPDIYGDTPPASVDGQPASSCLKVHATTQNFRKASPRLIRDPAGFTLTQYRSWILLEELAHLYYDAAKREPSIDVYNINVARKLPAVQAVANGPSYSYYAASVAAKCVDFPNPNPNPIRGHGLELLEVNPTDPDEEAPVSEDNTYTFAHTDTVKSTNVQLDQGAVTEAQPV
ncbi:MAG: hypothetical protein Q9178_004859 [Gyalolechia marmorata]